MASDRPFPPLAGRLRRARLLTKSLTTGRPVSAGRVSLISGLVRTHVWLIETGQRHEVTLDTIIKLSKTLGVSIDWLSRGKGPPPNEKKVLRAFARAKGAFERGEQGEALRGAGKKKVVRLEPAVRRKRLKRRAARRRPETRAP